jgi:5-methylphenazine-1-carboxylate 1-monooxygenase
MRYGDDEILIAGGGIGGLSLALMLHDAGLAVRLFEQAREFGELGVGVNLLPHAVAALADVGLLDALEAAGVCTEELVYATRRGQPVWQEPRGRSAGYDAPQISIHRGRLQGLLARAVRTRIGADHIHTGHVFTGFREADGRIVAEWRRRADEVSIQSPGAALIGCDGIHSTVRRLLYPDEGPPRSNGVLIWRGAVTSTAWRTGASMLVAGGSAAKFVCYPIAHDPVCPTHRLTNWGVMAPVDARASAARRGDWRRLAPAHDVLAFVQAHFSIVDIDVPDLIRLTEPIYEYVNCDRDPLPRWSFGRVTLLGDAAHAMYPMGSNGAGQAILDARALATHLRDGAAVVDGLAAYDQDRRPVTNAILLKNRDGGPERVIDLVEHRAPDGFADLDRVASYDERKAIVGGYASLAGYAQDRVNRRDQRRSASRSDSPL